VRDLLVLLAAHYFDKYGTPVLLLLTEHFFTGYLSKLKSWFTHNDTFDMLLEASSPNDVVSHDLKQNVSSFATISPRDISFYRSPVSA